MYTDFNSTITNFRERQLAILADDCADRGRSVLISAAENMTAPLLNEMLHLAHGHVYVVMGPERIKAFGLKRMETLRRFAAIPNTDLSGHCVSVEAREGVTTGISIADRVCTIRILGEEIPNPRKLISPGHIFPIEAREGGILVKNSLSEAALDVVSSFAVSDAVVTVELLGGDGDFLDPTEQRRLSEKHKIPIIKLSEVIRFKLENKKIIARVAQSVLPTEEAGELKAYVFKSTLHGGEHFVLVKGDISATEPVLTRVQMENTFSDVFGGAEISSRKIISGSLRAINDAGSGILVYLRRIDAGHLVGQVNSENNQLGPIPERMKEYGIGAQILRDLGVNKITLLTNSKGNLVGLKTFGIEIVATQSIPL